MGLKFLFTLLEYFFWVFHIKQTLVSDFIIHKIATSNRMTHSCLSYKWVLLIFFQGILLMSMSSCLKSKTIPALASKWDWSLGFTWLQEWDNSRPTTSTISYAPKVFSSRTVMFTLVRKRNLCYYFVIHRWGGAKVLYFFIEISRGSLEKLGV